MLVPDGQLSDEIRALEISGSLCTRNAAICVVIVVMVQIEDMSIPVHHKITHQGWKSHSGSDMNNYPRPQPEGMIWDLDPARLAKAKRCLRWCLWRFGMRWRGGVWKARRRA